MSWNYNFFTGGFDFNTADTAVSWKPSVATAGDLPLTGNSTGDARVVVDTGAVWVWNGSAWTNSSGISGIGSAVTGGTNKSVLFVDSGGNLAQDNSDFNYDSSTNILVVSGQVTTPVIDRASSGTLAIGTSANSSTINIGNSGATVNIQGTVLYENVTQLQVKDPLITLNKNGGVGSASNSGIELEENGSITGYAESSADRNSWILKAPNTAGIATITPGAGGITLSQSSHDPVTLAIFGSTPSSTGASLSSQVLTLQPADSTNPGGVSTGTQTFAGNKTFSGTISASNLSGTNTGDITLGAFGSTPSTSGASLSGQVLTLQPADATHSGGISTGTQTFAGTKTFAAVVVSGDLTVDTNTLYIDSTNHRVGILTTTPGANLSIGAGAARTIRVDESGTGAGNSLSVRSGAALTGGTDLSGGALNLVAGASTGAGGSSINLQTASSGTSGTTTNNPSTKLTISEVGGFTHTSEGSTTAYQMDAYAGGKNNFTLRSANGTKAVPTKITNGQTMVSIAARGYQETTSAFLSTSSTTIATVATEDFTSTAGGAKLVFSTTPNTTTTLTTALTLGQDQSATFTGAISASNFSGTSSGTNTGDITLGTFGSSPSNSGASLSGQILTLQPADSTHPGGLSTGVQSIAGAKTLLSALNMNSQFINSVLDPVSSQDAATKNYVDTVASALNPIQAAYAATTTGLTGTYLNGVAGLGATFTITATGAFTVDGTTPPINSRILLKDQGSGFQNGVYNLTVTGAIGISPILTRALDFDTASNINSGDLIPVINGTINTKTSWLQTATVTTVGSDSLVFVEWSYNPSIIVTTVGTIDSQTASSDGLVILGNSIFAQSASATNPGLVNNTTQTFSGNKTFTGTISASNFSGTSSGTNTGDQTNITGNAGSATTVATTSVSANATFYPLFVASSSNSNQAADLGTGLTFNPSTNTLTTTTFSGALSGNATTATTATNATNTAITDDTTTNATVYPTWVTATSGNLPQKVSSTKLTFNPNTGALTTSGTFSASNVSGSTSGTNTGDVTLSTFGSTPNANGASLSGQALTLQPADATNPGGVSTGTQTFAGTKTFSSTITGTTSGNTTYTANNHGVVVSSSTNAMSVIAPDASTTKVLKSGGTGADPTWLAYDNANTASTLVFRDSSNNFSAGTITAALSGNATTATTATNATNVATTSVSTNASFFPLFVASSSNSNQAADLGTGLTFNPSTNNLSTTTFTGALSGNATTATTATNATNVATTATNATNASFFPTFVASSSSSNQGIDTATGLSFNPSTNTLTTTTFSGALSGNATTATTATNATNIAITDDTTTNATVYPTWVTTTSGNLPAKVSSTKMSFNPSTGALTIAGALSASNVSGSTSGTNTGDVTLSAFGSSPNANGASLSGQALTLQPADGTNPGGVSTASQTFAGTKTFSAVIVSGDLTVDTNTFYVDSTNNRIGILTTTPSNALSFGAGATRVIRIEESGTGAGNALTVRGGSALTGGTDLGGGNVTVIAGNSTGTGGASVVFQTPTPSATGTTNNAPSTKLTISELGGFTHTSEGATSAYQMDAYAGGKNMFLLRSANGTKGTPTKISSGNTMSAINSRGYQETTSAFLTTNSTSIASIATEDFTSTAGGAKITFATTPNTTTTLTTALTLDQDQSGTFVSWAASTNHVQGFRSTATAGGTTTLTKTDTYYQAFTGATTQNCDMPVVTTLQNGWTFRVTNTSTGTVTVRSSGGNTIKAMAQNSMLDVWVINTGGGTGTASWNWQYTATLNN